MNTGSVSPSGSGTGRLLNGKYVTARSAGNYFAWGKSRLFLYPNIVYGPDGVIRNDMAIHGGTFPGSAGCIDLCGNAPTFFKAFKNHHKPVYLNVRY